MMDEAPFSKWVLVKNIPVKNSTTIQVPTNIRENNDEQNDQMTSKDSDSDQCDTLIQDSSLDTDFDSSFDIIEENFLDNDDEQISKSNKEMCSKKSQSTQISSEEFNSGSFFIIPSVTVTIIFAAFAIYKFNELVGHANSSNVTHNISHSSYLILVENIKTLEQQLELKEQKYMLLSLKMKLCLDENSLEKNFLEHHNHSLYKLDQIYGAIAHFNRSLSNVTEFILKLPLNQSPSKSLENLDRQKSTKTIKKVKTKMTSSKLKNADQPFEKLLRNEGNPDFEFSIQKVDKSKKKENINYDPSGTLKNINKLKNKKGTSEENLENNFSKLENDDSFSENIIKKQKFKSSNQGDDKSNKKENIKNVKNEQNSFMKKIESLKADMKQKYSNAKKVIKKKMNEHVGKLLEHGSQIFSQAKGIFNNFFKDYDTIYNNYVKKFATPVDKKLALPMYYEFKKIFEEKTFSGAPMKQKNWLLCQYDWWNRYLNTFDFHDILPTNFDYDSYDCSANIFKWQKNQFVSEHSQENLNERNPNVQNNNCNNNHNNYNVKDDVSDNSNDIDDINKTSEHVHHNDGYWYFRKFKPVKSGDTSWYLWMLERSLNKKN